MLGLLTGIQLEATAIEDDLETLFSGNRETIFQSREIPNDHPLEKLRW